MILKFIFQMLCIPYIPVGRFPFNLCYLVNSKKLQNDRNINFKYTLEIAYVNLHASIILSKSEYIVNNINFSCSFFFLYFSSSMLHCILVYIYRQYLFVFDYIIKSTKNEQRKCRKKSLTFQFPVELLINISESNHVTFIPFLSHFPFFVSIFSYPA